MEFKKRHLLLIVLTIFPFLVFIKENENCFGVL